MADLKTHTKLIELGEQLAESLGPPHEVDALSRWMAYYVGEQINAVKTSTGAKRNRAEQRAFETILELWAHRDHLPNGFRPFRGFEPILKALESLDPDSPRPAYLRLRDAHEKSGRDAQREKIESWLGFVHSVDSTARILIDIGLTLAARQAETSSTGIALESAPESTSPDDSVVIRNLLRRSKVSKKEDTAAVEIDRLETRVGQLAWFRRVSKKMEKHLALELKRAKRKLPPKAS